MITETVINEGGLKMKKETLEIFSKRVRILRKGKGWTQKELAERIGEGVSTQIVSNWERAYTSPEFEDIPRIAEALEVPIDYLLGKTDDPTPPDSNKMPVVDLKQALEDTAHWNGYFIDDDQKELIKRLILAVIERDIENESDDN
jgi:transcriptional regulator with XRE-family HTH domain